MTTIALILSFVVGMLASLVAAFLFAPTHDIFIAAAVRALGWIPFRRRISLAGIWTSVWYVQSARYPPKVVDEKAMVRQLGRRFYAKFKTPTFDCYLVGLIDGGRYITGRWHDAAEGGYHGAFQFIIDPSNHNFTGRWVGFSASGVVKDGLWEWERPSGGGSSLP